MTDEQVGGGIAEHSKPITRRRSMHVLGVTAFSITVISALWLSFTPIAVPVQQDLGIGTARFGLLVSACFLLTAVFTPVAGNLADRHDLRWIQIVMLLVALVGTLISAVAGSFLWFALARLVVGASAAAFVLSLRQALLVVPGHRAGLVQGFIGMSFSSGVAATALVMPALSNAVGWRTALAVVSLAAVPAIWWQWRLPEEGRRPPHVPAPAGGDGGGALRGAGSLIFANFVVFGGTLTVTSFLPLFFVSTLPFDTRTAGLLTALAVGISGTGRILGGWLADVVGGLRALMACMAVACVTLFLLHGTGAAVAVTVGASAFLLIAFNAAGGAVFAIAARRLAPARLGRALGFVAAGGVTGGMLLATPYGLLVERTDAFLASNASIVVLGLVATGVVALALRKPVSHRALPAP